MNDVIIVDDEYPAREELKYFITTCSKLHIVGEFADGIEVLKYLQNHDVAAIFLDINIPMLDGVVLGRSLHRFERPPKIIFVTAYREHAADAFEINAFDYVLKPYSESRIKAVLTKLETALAKEQTVPATAVEPAGPVMTQAPLEPVAPEENHHTVCLWQNDKIILVHVQDIYYCEANNRTTYVYTKKERYTVNQTISEFYDSLPHPLFFKCHRSYVVNIDKIAEIIPWFNNTYNLSLEGIAEKIPVSRSNVKQFKQLMHL